MLLSLTKISTYPGRRLFFLLKSDFLGHLGTLDANVHRCACVTPQQPQKVPQLRSAVLGIGVAYSWGVFEGFPCFGKSVKLQLQWHVVPPPAFRARIGAIRLEDAVAA